LTGSGKFQGLNLDAVGILPLTEKFSAFGRVGYIYTESKDNFRGTGAGAAVAAFNPNPKEKDGNYKYGLGVQYDFTYNLGLRVEWERYRVNDAVGNKGDIDMALIGLVYTFGAAKPAPRAATPPPAYVAPVVAAAPVLVIVPVARTQQYCGILDIQFEINRDVIQREEQEKLAVLETFLRKYPDTTAVIEGHTDEVGTDADNMRLSQRRAESVVSYLAGRGIARSRLQAVGYGETRPIADNRTEIGKRLNRRINAIVACATDIQGLTTIPARTTMAMEMEFDTNSASIRQQDREELRKVANFMKANPRVTATVEGHTSNQQGTAAQAMQLSVRRAESVVNALANLGVDRTQLFVAGFGETRRFAYNTSVEGQQENRRVNIIFDFPK
jgi:OOP family OmpA-OmpF porin